MSIRTLTTSALATLGLATMVSAPVSAERARPLCTTEMSRQFCRHVFDPNDCFMQNGVEYCRTITFFRWYSS